MVVKLNFTFLYLKNQKKKLLCQGKGQTAFWQSWFLPISLMHYGTAKLQHGKMLTCNVQSVAVTCLTQTLFYDYIMKLMEMQLLLLKKMISFLLYSCIFLVCSHSLGFFKWTITFSRTMLLSPQYLCQNKMSVSLLLI